MTSELSREGFLFPTEFIKKENLQDSHLVARPLHITDYDKGYCQLLGQLTEIGDITKAKFVERFRDFQMARDAYFIVVIEDTSIGKIISAASLVIEKKVIRGAAKCGHIEDVVVDSTYRGKQLGKRVIDQLVHVGSLLGCYKIILDCSEKNVEFYNKCGFTKKEVQMAMYIPKSSL